MSSNAYDDDEEITPSTETLLRDKETGNFSTFYSPGKGLEYTDGFAQMVRELFLEAAGDAPSLSPGEGVTCSATSSEIFHGGKRYFLEISIKIGLPNTKSLS